MTARTITTAAELDALPVGSVVLGADHPAEPRRPLGERISARWDPDARWNVDGRHYYGATETVLAVLGGAVTVLHDPAASAPAPSVVPEAAVEAAASAVRKERAFSAAVAFGVPMDDVPQCAEMIVRAALTAALPLLTAAPSATRDEVARSIPVDALATFITGHGGDFETGQWRVELAFPLSEPVSVDSWRQDLIDAITPKEDR